VHAYTTNSNSAATIAAPGSAFNPPASVPFAAADWFSQLTQTSVTIGGFHPFLDPSAYRVDMIFQLAEKNSGIANLYDTLLRHYSIIKPTDALGKTYDYVFTYDSNALAAFQADTTGTYRYVKLPDAINLGNPKRNLGYSVATTTVPGLEVGGDKTPVTIPATSVEFGLTIPKGAPNQQNAIKFLQLLFSSQGIAIQQVDGPAPISPPLVSHEDFERLPHPLRSLVGIDPRQDRR